MHPLLFRLVDANRILGTGRMLWTAPGWLLRPEYVALTGDPARPIPDAWPRQGCLRWTTFTEADIPQVLALNPLNSEAGLRRRLEAGQEGLLGWVGDALAYYRWDAVGPARVPYFHGAVELREADLFTIVAFAHPSFRGQGLHSSATSMVLRAAGERGLRRTITFVAWWNAPALRVAEKKAGRERVGTLGWWNVGPWRRPFATGDICLARDGSIRIT